MTSTELTEIRAAIELQDGLLPPGIQLGLQADGPGQQRQLRCYPLGVIQGATHAAISSKLDQVCVLHHSSLCRSYGILPLCPPPPSPPGSSLPPPPSPLLVCEEAFGTPLAQSAWEDSSPWCSELKLKALLQQVSAALLLLHRRTGLAHGWINEHTLLCTNTPAPHFKIAGTGFIREWLSLSRQSTWDAPASPDGDARDLASLAIRLLTRDPNYAAEVAVAPLKAINIKRATLSLPPLSEALWEKLLPCLLLKPGALQGLCFELGQAHLLNPGGSRLGQCLNRLPPVARKASSSSPALLRPPQPRSHLSLSEDESPAAPAPDTKAEELRQLREQQRQAQEELAAERSSNALQLAALRETLETSQRASEQKARELAELHRHLEDLNRKLSSAQALANQQPASDGTSNPKETSALHEELKRLHAEVAARKEELLKTSSHNEKLQLNIEELRRELGSGAKSLKDLTLKNQELSASLEASRRSAAEAATRVPAPPPAQGEIENLRNENSRLLAQCSELKTRSQRMESEQNRRIQELEQLAMRTSLPPPPATPQRNLLTPALIVATCLLLGSCFLVWRLNAKNDRIERLLAERPVPSSVGYVIVKSTPTATLSIEGMSPRKTPTVLRDIPIGTLQAELRAPGYKTRQVTLTIANPPKEEDFVLQKE